ncbi:hypothetical protein CONPUDRAFT_135123 [Coniophora puteana RWD-64-598 SS2]|uniref:EF-hand n=1 Tax=Coniophora puteana (strain RWD-64-598) TaxID=741705 RepID=A0A5M3N257_CONPW|nr:uncharacterized protein CONPUDRAFT_135123 [Coniophora puteana RWD-64-598 SS2]EIW85357.1 hypothetical protein CONPUDRAFT_135123 [Coniophora puteana RWD-64-598 SS2]
MASTFNPTHAELALVNHIFAKADTQQIGILTGDVAVKIFGGAKLQASVLGEIWAIADEDNNGFLTKKGVAVAVRLMGHAQKGEKVSTALLSRPGPLVNIEGFQAPLAPQSTGMSIPKSPPPGLPPLTPQDKTKFLRLFQNCGPVNGLVSGEKARDVFVKSKLPVDKLSQIWTLCDTQDRGLLDSTDFTIAMYLIQGTMSGALSFIPTTLPPGLYEQAGGRQHDGVASHATGSSLHSPVPPGGAFPAAPRAPQRPLHPQSTGPAAPPLPSRPPAGSNFAPAVPPFPSIQTNNMQWDVTPAEKASSDQFFDTLDTQKRGFIEGDVAVPFMLQSKLSEDVLAQVWDLADINNDGRLTRDGFAVGMHLIQGKLTGKEVPSSLPPSLVPPSMRGANAGAMSSPFGAPAPKPQEPARDLLWDDSPPPSAGVSQPPSILQPQSTGTMLQPQSTGSILQPQSTGQRGPSAQSSAFAMPSSFAPPQPQPQPQPQLQLQAPATDPFGSSSFGNDLLGDDDDVQPSQQPVQEKAAEIGNVQNQLNSTNASAKSAKAAREELEATLAAQASQLSALQTQLTTAKASYETEMNLLSTLRERHTAQTEEINKVRQELISAESDLSAIRVEKTEIEGAFLRDKEEVRDLNRRMTETTAGIAQIKGEVEKAKKNAKQQKGLLAIARKQLATKETEKVKADAELREAEAEVVAATKEREEAEAEAQKVVAGGAASVAAADTSIDGMSIGRSKSPVDSLSMAVSQPLPLSPDVTGGVPTSPSASLKSNNPFERLAMTSGLSTPRPQSPFMPFANASVPTPTVQPTPAKPEAESEDDPFGLSSSFSAEEPKVDDKVPEPKTPQMPGGMFGDDSDIVASPTTDSFMTPGTSPAQPKPSTMDQAASQFPALEEMSTMALTPKAEEHETDLNAHLKELDVDESDSDSDSDDDDKPLSTPKAPESEAAKAAAAAEPAPTVTPSSAFSFEDAFGAGEAVQPAAQPQAEEAQKAVPLAAKPAADVFGAPAEKPAAADDWMSMANGPSGGAEQQRKGSALENFDEAFGKMPSTGHDSNDSSKFTFDSTFDDNFDFASASATSAAAPGAASAFPPPPAAQHANGHALFGDKASMPAGAGQPAANGQAQQGPGLQNQTSISFDDAFMVGSPSASAPAPSAQAVKQDAPAISFDDVFGGDGANALKLDNSFASPTIPSSNPTPTFNANGGAPTTNVFAPPPGSPPASSDGARAFPGALTPPTSPRASSSRSSGPERAASPPPRVGSPRIQRPSTSSSQKDGKEHDHPREKPAPPPRHSKLSIRLPFGKKKKQDAAAAASAAPPMPPSSLGHQLAPLEEPSNVTPAVEDDVEPVKQLAAMGFSRNQAVAALEAHDYDVQRALNTLLGAQ